MVPAASTTPSPLRSALDAAFSALPEHVIAGGDPCAELSAIYDRALAERFTAAAAGASAPLALVATGGWARRELAPYSDIDFIVLHDRDDAAAKQVADRLLYPLWDDKLAVGHQVRDARGAARLARGDLATATALLDARHIAGDRRLTAELVRATQSAVAPGGNPNDLIAVLADEQRGRHDRFGASLYLLEPNLKQGIGALRDLATALWAAQARWASPRPDRDPPGADALVAALVGLGHLTRRQGDVLVHARAFQLRIRALVQLAARRRFDQLTFEIQEAIAPRLYPDARAGEGDIRSAVGPAVELLMRDYYVHARGVVQVAERLLDSARVPSRRRPRIATVDASFITWNGELAIRDPRLFVERPSEMVRLFRVAVGERVDVYGHTRELIAETIARTTPVGAPVGTDPIARRLLLDALLDLRDAGQPSALELMHQVGILSAVMPEWAPCTARVQHDLYHVYTVDQHQLYAVAMQKKLARGEYAAEHPTATELWREVTQPGPLLLATLLHDVGKPLGKGHAEKGAIVAGAVARRLGMTEADAELVEFLVRQHLTMSHLSQRRDLADPDVVERFAEKVGDEAHLVTLYLLTLCDTAMTAPNNLSAWKDELLRDLVLRTRAHFRGRAVETRELDARTKAIELVDDPVASAVVDAFDPQLFTQLTPRQVARHRAAAGASARPATAGRHRDPLLSDQGPQRARRRRARRARRARGDRRRARRASRRRARRRARSRRARAGAGRRRVLRPRPQGRGDRRRRRALAAAARGSEGDLRGAGEPPLGGRADRAAPAAVEPAAPGHAGGGDRDPPARRLDAGDHRRGHDPRPRRRAARDHADARRAGPRYLAREGRDRGREGRRRVLRDARGRQADRPGRARGGGAAAGSGAGDRVRKSGPGQARWQGVGAARIAGTSRSEDSR